MSLNQPIHYRAASGVGTIIFNRPPANAYEIEFHTAFNAAIDQAEADCSVRSVVLASASQKFFCAGADIKLFQANTTADNHVMVQAARQALSKITCSSKIWICKIAGHALGGGLEIALACDLRYAAEGEYLLGLPEVKLGLMPGNGGTQRLTRLVGASRALELITTGDTIGPEQALGLGIVDKLFPASELDAVTQALAEKIAAGPPAAIAAIKRAVQEGVDLPLADALALEQSLSDTLYNTSDAAEGLKAFQEKRPPVFTGQ